MIDQEFNFFIVYEQHEFVDLNKNSIRPTGYTRKKQVFEYFKTKKELNTFIDKYILNKNYIYSYRIFECLPISDKIELNEFKQEII